MKRRDLDRALKKAGWQIYHGGSHDKAKHPNKPGLTLILPRHAEVNELTVLSILKTAGLK